MTHPTDRRDATDDEVRTAARRASDDLEPALREDPTAVSDTAGMFLYDDGLAVDDRRLARIVREVLGVDPESLVCVRDGEPVVDGQHVDPIVALDCADARGDEPIETATVREAFAPEPFDPARIAEGWRNR